MAQRRMFSLKVVDTDLFLDMPVSARLLYYDLTIRADDDGFIASSKRIQRMIGCSDDDFKLLSAKQFIIPFANGVCVIKHWNIHNKVPPDRYNESIYTAEKSELTKVNKIYELLPKNECNTKCIQNYIQLDYTG